MAKKKTSKKTAGRISAADLRSLINQNAGSELAHDLTTKNPSEVSEWIPTGSRWLDGIICRGKLAGIPMGRITEIAGLQATGKSYLAAQIAANAQKMGKTVIYFDSESAIDPNFWEASGIDVSKMIYVQAKYVEFVFSQIEFLLASAPEESFVFIWDSLAFTPCQAALEAEGEFTSVGPIATKPKILNNGMDKLIQPIANSNSALIVLNQLRTNISSNVYEMRARPYFTPGGKAMDYAASLRIWLTGRNNKNSKVFDDKGFEVGSEVAVRLEKSRFGTRNRQCGFKILWGDNVGVQDEESWFEAVKSSPKLKSGGAWWTLTHEDGTEQKFQSPQWIELLNNDNKFRDQILRLMDEEVIFKFDDRSGDASNYYDNEDLSEE